MQNQQQSKFWAKGSGSTGVLLNGTLQDQSNFEQLNLKTCLKSNHIQQICLSGLYAIAITTNSLIKQSSLNQDKSLEDHQSQQSYVYAWGNINNQIVQIPYRLKIPNQLGRPRISQISCGWNHTIIRQENKTLYGFGQNRYKQLSQDNKQFYEQPILITKQAIVIAAGFRQTYWTTEENLMACGQSKNYEISNSHPKPLPSTQISTQQNNKSQIKKIACGKKFVLFLTNKNQVQALGTNQHNSIPSCQKIFKTPTIVKQNIKDISCGWGHSLMINADGKVYSYGRNNLGQCGREKQNKDEKENGSNNFQVKIEEACQSITAGTQFSFAIGSSGKLYGWGWNQHLNILKEGEPQVIYTAIQIPIPANTYVTNCITYPAITIIQTKPIAQ